MMRPLQARLEALEAARGTSLGRVFRVVGGDAAADPVAFLANLGQVVRLGDLILHRPIMSPSPAGPVLTDTPMRMVGA